MPGHRPASLHAAPPPGARPRRRGAQDGVARLLAWPPPLGVPPGLGDSAQPARRLSAERPDHVWALDFQFDQTADGRVLKLLNIVDEHTREALAIVAARRINADATAATLDRIVAVRGTAPGYIRCDNGPELTANALRDWCRSRSMDTSWLVLWSPALFPTPRVERFAHAVSGGREPGRCLQLQPKPQNYGS